MNEPLIQILLVTLSIAFTCWAGVIAWIGNGIRQDLKEESRKLNQYIVRTEQRLAILETHMGMKNHEAG